jgi:hypothetical protein
MLSRVWKKRSPLDPPSARILRPTDYPAAGIRQAIVRLFELILENDVLEDSDGGIIAVRSVARRASNEHGDTD